MPKFIGPYEMTKSHPNESKYMLDLPLELKAQRIHPSFHILRLCHYISNDNKVFPRCEVCTYYDFSDAKDNEWLVDGILTHQWNGNKVLFLVQWNLGDTTWEQYSECKDLEALDRYLELLGIDENNWKRLLRKASITTEQMSRSLNANKPTRRVARKRN
jgi:hypothetical protein